MKYTLALILGLAASIASASETLTLDAAKSDEIKAKLTEQGYEVRRVDIEDGMYEVYSVKDGKKLELYLDETLAITRTKSED